MSKITFRGPSDGHDRKWTPGFLQHAENEGKKLLNEPQYAHAVQSVLRLCEEDDPTHPTPLSDVKSIDEFYELRDKHGVLGKINLRIFFALFKKERALVVLGVWNKKNQNQTPPRIVKRMKWRKRTAESLIQAQTQSGVLVSRAKETP